MYTSFYINNLNNVLTELSDKKDFFFVKIRDELTRLVSLDDPLAKCQGAVAYLGLTGDKYINESNVDRLAELVFWDIKSKFLNKNSSTDSFQANPSTEGSTDVNLPEKVSVIVKELTSRINTSTGDSSADKVYLDTIKKYPWNNSSKLKPTISQVKSSLDSSMFGFSDIKEKILSSVASYLRTGNLDFNLGLVGSPGVGKSFFAEELSKALGRKFVRISLGGLNEPVEIKGLNRGYKSSLPGRIIRGIIDCGENNPVILLDEIDKITINSNGQSPADCLLELLDNSHKKSFVDNYLEVPVDLSKVIFICTANSIDNISSALRSRINFITIPDYSIEEKVGIANNFLIPKNLQSTGLFAKEIYLDQDFLHKMVARSNESGVRKLNNKLNELFSYAVYSLDCSLCDDIFYVNNSVLDKVFGSEENLNNLKDYVL